MTDQKRIAELERRMAEQEIRVAARIDTVIEAMAASQGVAVDALVLIAIRDRKMVEDLLRLRRLEHQTNGSGTLSGEMVKLYESALGLAEALNAGAKLGPR